MGRVDLFHSRRTGYVDCKFWIRDERNQSGSPQQWVLYNQPSGIFHAKPVSARDNQMNVINGVWALDRNHITIETDDDVPDLTRGCLVEYCDELYLVETSQGIPHLKELEFNKHPDYKYVISLTKG